MVPIGAFSFVGLVVGIIYFADVHSEIKDAVKYNQEWRLIDSEKEHPYIFSVLKFLAPNKKVK
jgi:hypothetical protein